MSEPVVFSDDFYARLGMPHTASRDEIKRAYLQLVKSYPPERAPEEFKRIREAYETLISPSTRQEYDRRPDPAVHECVRRAQEAMTSKDYVRAERHFKEALVKAPELHFVRNMLGLCFLYQGEAEKAVVQYERLLKAGEVEATWLGNAGVAYRMAKRYGDAERAFKEAILRSDDVAVDYYIGLADVFVDQGQHGNALKVLEKGIGADAKIDFNDLRFFMKLLEVHLRGGDMVGVRRSIQRVRDVAALLEEQRAFAAWKLGELGQHLIVASGFEYATVVLEGAKALQPSDPDYKVLLTLSALLRRNQFSTAKTLVTTHPSFEPQKRLFGLRERVERYCAERKVLEDLQPISSAPSLYTVNGVGTALYGQRDHDSRTGSYVATLFFVVLFIPLVPLGCYRVIPQGNRSWSFLGKVPFSNQERWHLRISVGLAAAFILWALASSDGGSSRPSAYVGTSTYGAPFTSSSIYSSQTPGSVAQPPSTRSTGLDSWYYAEKAQVEAMEEDLRSMDSELEGKADEIEGLKHRIQAIEQGYGEATTEDPLYTTLLHQHNGVVSDYNDLLERRKTRYQEYETDLDQVNARVDDYNARH